MHLTKKCCEGKKNKLYRLMIIMKNKVSKILTNVYEMIINGFLKWIETKLLMILSKNFFIFRKLVIPPIDLLFPYIYDIVNQIYIKIIINILYFALLELYLAYFIVSIFSILINQITKLIYIKYINYFFLILILITIFKYYFL